MQRQCGTLCRSLILTFFLGATVLPTRVLAAAGDEYWDDRFGDLAIEGQVGSLTVDRDITYLGGGFQRAMGMDVGNIVAWDGQRWFGLGGGVSSSAGLVGVSTMLTWRGQLYVGGFFDGAGTVQTKGIACWDGTGWSDVGGGLSGSLGTLAASGDYLYAAGNFVSAGGVVVHNVARWDGQHWEVLGAGVAGSWADAIAVHRGAVYVSGRGDLEPSWLGQWNGSEFSRIGTAQGGIVRCLQSTSFGLVAAGEPRVIGGVSNSVALWDGTKWSGPGDRLNELGYSMCVAEIPGAVCVGGYLAKAGTLEVNHLAGWDGQKWFAFGQGVRGDITATAVRALAYRPGELLVGGAFTNAGGKAASNFSIYHLPRTLVGRRSGQQVVLSWPKADTNLILEVTTRLDPPDWQPVPTPPMIANNRLSVTNTIAPGATFYRLREP